MSTPTDTLPETNTSARVASFAEVIGAVHPHDLPYMPESTQRAVAAALTWFVGVAPRVASDHCTDLVDGVPVAVADIPAVTAERACRPATFRVTVNRLKTLVDDCELAVVGAHNSLPETEMRRVMGMTSGESPRPSRVGLLGPLEEDFEYVSGWLRVHGTNAGWWSYRWVRLCLWLADIDSEASCEHLAAKLIDSYQDNFAVGTIGKDQQ